VVVALVLALVVAITLVVPALIFTGELLVVAAGVALRIVLGRPWLVEARSGDTRRTWRVEGLRGSTRFMRELEQLLSRGEPLPPD
jgi:membrane protein implicated in regulation of membrane protease activity